MNPIVRNADYYMYAIRLSSPSIYFMLPSPSVPIGAAVCGPCMCRTELNFIQIGTFSSHFTRRHLIVVRGGKSSETTRTILQPHQAPLLLSAGLLACCHLFYVRVCVLNIWYVRVHEKSAHGIIRNVGVTVMIAWRMEIYGIAPWREF